MFTHYRLYDPNNNTLLPCGGATIKYSISPDKKLKDIDPEEEITVEYAVALCSKKDHFCYRTGRIVASGKFESDRLRGTTTIPLKLLSNFLYGCVSNASSKNKLNLLSSNERLRKYREAPPSLIRWSRTKGERI